MSNTTAHTGHERKHLPESHIRLSGQGLKLAGQGLLNLGSLAHGHAKNEHGKIGAAIIHAIGHTSKSRSKDKRKAFGKKLVQLLKKHHFPSHSHNDIHGIVNKYKHHQIGIKDIFGKAHAQQGKRLIESLMGGGSILGSIGHAFKSGYKKVKKGRDAVIHKLRQFANGKTKFKPSQLANYLAGAVGIAGAASAFIPGIDLISVPAAGAVSLGLKSVGTVLKTSGRGINLAGSGFKLPAKIEKYVKAHPVEAKRVLAVYKRQKMPKKQAGKGKKIKAALVTAGAIMLFGFLKDNAGNLGNIGRAISASITGGGLGVAGSGTKIPDKIKAYMKAHPAVSKRIAKKTKQSGEGLTGRGAGSRFTAAMGLAGTSAAAGAYGMYRYLMANPSVAAKIAAKGVGGLIGSYLKGGSIYAGAGCKCKKMTGSGASKAKKSKKGGCRCLTRGKGLGIAGSGAEQFSAVQNSYEGGAALPYGVTRLPSGKVKKDRYSVYYGYYNKTGSGLNKDSFALKGKKVVSKRRQALGKQNMNFRRSRAQI